MVKISVNTSHPMFSGLDLKKTRIVVGTLDDPSLFFNFATYPQTNMTNADTATCNRILECSPSRPIYFENYDYALLGNINDVYQMSRAASVLVNYIRKGILIFEKDGVAQTADEVIQFTP